MGQAGDRDDGAIRDFARSAWRFHPDRIVLKEMEKYLRGRAYGEVTALLEAEFLRLGASPEAIGRAESEFEAVVAALEWARPGDLLDRLQAANWLPGSPIPA
jgi:hypothetical protein